MSLTMGAPQDLEERLKSIQYELLSVPRHSEIKRQAMVDNTPTRRILPERVPDDVIREIFLACRPIEGIPTMDTNEIPMALTRISSRWRSVALSTPRLWNAIHIPIVNIETEDNRGRAIMRGRLKEISEWLLWRSGALPLRISIYQQPHSGRDNLFVAGVVYVLMKCRARWRYLDLTGTSNLFPLILVDPSSVPLLQGLRIVCLEDNTDTPDQGLSQDWHTSPILTAPRLQRLSVISTAISFSTCQINWSRLTHLSFANCNSSRNDDHMFTFPALVHVLRRTPQLFSLVFHDAMRQIDLNRMVIIRGPKIRLPCLEILDVRESPGVKRASLLHMLDVPSLIDFTYMCNVVVKCPFPEDDHATAFQCLLALSSGKIRRLKTNILHVYSALMNHLHFCPALSILELMPHPCIYHPEKQVTIGDNLLDVLSSDDPGRGNPCPKLEYLRCLTHSKFSSNAIIAFSQQRKLGGDISGTPKQFILQIGSRAPPDLYLTADNWDPRTFQLIHERPYMNGIPLPKYPLDLGLDRDLQNCPLVT
ncbi:hypothetical protein HYPSUDRAFT_217518 [Hypholoma sublateritium FD-334 SS-4]|uniref:F-box domain-containing protein n=1 Tax=Hypholoma sublateritium (strain FD-334 SS-4) TaxID=945553 RepID=A0A0D2NSC1_HYPSF|nr:hypothetical protein HYPSUDRAFT_217518 [Hypholoma sublateritium FD-334 SS-4]